MHTSPPRDIRHPHHVNRSAFGIHALISIKNCLPGRQTDGMFFSVMKALRLFSPLAPLAVAVIVIAVLSPSLPAAVLLEYTFAGGSAAPTTQAEDVTGSNAAWNNLPGSGFSNGTNTAFIPANNTPTTFTSDKYLEFTISADPGFVLDLESLEFRLGGQNSSGTLEYTVYANVRSSADSFASDLLINPGDVTTASHTVAPGNTTSYSTFTVDLSELGNVTALTLRLYPSDDSAISNSYYRYDWVRVNGSVDVVPEPSALPLLVGSFGLLASNLRRRRNPEPAAPSE
jgi:hypothetical protein